MGDVNEAVFSPNLYFDSSFDIDAAKNIAGEYYVTSANMVLVTVLGSCVAACIRDRVSGIGGMNHFMLPDNNRDSSDPTSTSARYGNLRDGNDDKPVAENRRTPWQSGSQAFWRGRG